MAGAALPSAGSGASSGIDSAGVSVGPPSGPLPQPVSDAQIRRELAASGQAAHAGQATLTAQGLALAPINAPAIIQQVISAGNQIAHLPYRFGGGHGTFIDNAYDCSGSLSFVFAAAGILNTTMTSGQLMSWGKPGPGKWITVFADNGHTFAYVAGLRFDTVALAQTGSRWSNRGATEPKSEPLRGPPPRGFVAGSGRCRHRGSAELEQEIRHPLRRLDLRAMADPAQQLEARAGHHVQDPLGAAVEDQPIPVSPHEQHGDRDPLERERLAQLRNQAPRRLKITRDGGTMAMVVGERRHDAAIDRARRSEGELEIQPRDRGPEDHGGDRCGQGQEGPEHRVRLHEIEQAGHLEAGRGDTHHSG